MGLMMTFSTRPTLAEQPSMVLFRLWISCWCTVCSRRIPSLGTGVFQLVCAHEGSTAGVCSRRMLCWEQVNKPEALNGFDWVCWPKKQRQLPRSTPALDDLISPLEGLVGECRPRGALPGRIVNYATRYAYLHIRNLVDLECTFHCSCVWKNVIARSMLVHAVYWTYNFENAYVLLHVAYL